MHIDKERGFCTLPDVRANVCAKIKSNQIKKKRFRSSKKNITYYIKKKKQNKYINYRKISQSNKQQQTIKVMPFVLIMSWNESLCCIDEKLKKRKRNINVL